MTDSSHRLSKTICLTERGSVDRYLLTVGFFSSGAGRCCRRPAFLRLGCILLRSARWLLVLTSSSQCDERCCVTGCDSVSISEAMRSNMPALNVSHCPSLLGSDELGELTESQVFVHCCLSKYRALLTRFRDASCAIAHANLRRTLPI